MFRGAMGAFGSGGGGGVVALSGQSIFDIGSGARIYRAALVILPTGRLQEIINGNIASDIDVSTDWIIPNGAAPDDYEFRFTGLTGDSPNGSTNMVENVWEAVVGNTMFIDQQVLLVATDSRVTNFTLELRKGSAGAALVTNNYTLDIERII